MKTQQKTAEWKLELSAIAEEVKKGNISPEDAVSYVFEAYEIFLEETYRSPRRQKDREADKVWEARPNLNCPAAELSWWARSMQNRAGRGWRRIFFTSEALQEAISAITEAYRAKLRRLYGPPAWRWEP